MDWYIRLYETLPEHPKTYALAETLGIKQPHAVGLLVCLWIWALRDAVTGDLSHYPDYAISNACRWDKQPKKLVDALISCGWIEQDRHLHDWSEYAGELIERAGKTREQSRIRQQNRRDKIKAVTGESRTSHANVTRDNRDGHAPTRGQARANQKNDSDSDTDSVIDSEYQEPREAVCEEVHTATSSKAKRFEPPDVDAVTAYCAERRNDVDPQRFVDFYTAKGWRVGNQPMRDWRAAVRTWEQRDGNKTDARRPTGGSPPANTNIFADMLRKELDHESRRDPGHHDDP